MNADLSFKLKKQDIRNIFIRDFKVLINLAEKEEDVNKVYQDGCTAIFYTAQAKNYNKTKILLEKGADVDKQNDSGDSVLHLAAAEGHDGIINLLIEYNASLGKVNIYEETPFDKAVKNSNDWIRNGHFSSVLHLLGLDGTRNDRGKSKEA